jgi:hypothetical protein
MMMEIGEYRIGDAPGNETGARLFPFVRDCKLISPSEWET